MMHSGDEFKSMYLGLQVLPFEAPRLLAEKSMDNNSSLPESADWRQKGIITPVKDQGKCRSSWAFATGKINSHYIVKKDNFFSPQRRQLKVMLFLEMVHCRTYQLSSLFPALQYL